MVVMSMMVVVMRSMNILFHYEYFGGMAAIVLGSDHVFENMPPVNARRWRVKGGSKIPGIYGVCRFDWREDAAFLSLDKGRKVLYER